MAFGLIINTPRALALQQAIQDELMTRGYSTDADPVMAEYITIMIINNKTVAQITSELQDLIGSDFDPTFTDWLFREAEKGSIETDTPLPEPSAEPSERPAEPVSTFQPPPNDSSRRSSHPPRNGVYQQALSQVLPSSSQKRPASARSPSPSHPNKLRRTELPTGPRAMYRDGQSGTANSRSLLDRVGGPVGGGQDEIQARIDTIVNTGDPMMTAGGFPGMNGMDMTAMAAGMANPMMIQELMMNQMALMAHFTGIMNPGQFGGFPMQGVIPPEMAMMQQNMGANGFQAQSNGSNRGRGVGSRGRGGGGRGQGGQPSSSVTSKIEEVPSELPVSSMPVVAPTPSPVIQAPVSDSTPTAHPRPAYAVPERPQSPTLCKFGLKCTNAHCRWSHPSPVATVESGVVLSNDPCENGKDCKDKDCIKAHVSPATLKPQDHAAPAPISYSHSHSFSPSNSVPCRFGAACTRPNCSFAHPQRQNTAQCKFGAACTRTTCQFQHPPGRVLPTAFHRGLSENGPLVTVKNPEPGSMGGPSPHRTATFNHPKAGGSTKENLEKQMREIEARKNQAEKAVREAQAAATNGQKEDVKSVKITA
ncbi:hypothetical protein J3R30DRAFT_3448938 [Lentinula aciculospora]|uniref:Nab2 type CCCH zinc finger 4 domain-containing protein n=1 Tax=Lentinula aciculospora TaxID=153920 RepID=A0A9W9AKD8_9AGAR|nr:hypothetical protein J3R30DRAFT_3448938 [Lentinula aciculospora]